jgi:hypothetical protein
MLSSASDVRMVHQLVEISGFLNLCISPVTNNTTIMADLAPKGPEIFYETILQTIIMQLLLLERKTRWHRLC